VAESVDEPHGVGVVADAEIAPDLPFLDVPGVDAEDDLHLLPEFLQQPDLDVGIVTGALSRVKIDMSFPPNSR
jgi:hypothetical protein